MSTLLLTSEDLQHVVRQVGIDALMDELIERLTTALREFDPDQTEIPVRSGFHYEHPVTGMIEWMPLLERNHSVLMKTVGYHPESPDLHNMPTILSNLSKYDPATGHLEALLDGTLLTAMRTGAASAVASRVFARPGSATIGLIGCGAQAVTQLHALGRMFPLTEALIYDTDAAAVRSFPARVAPFCSPELSIASSEPEAILARADILCVATSVAIGAGPVFSPGPTRPWLHINAVGSDFPGKTEIPESMLLESIVCPDSLEQAHREGECQQLPDHRIGPDLVRVVQQPPAAADAQERLSVFDSTGWALEDQVVMELLLERAAELGIGSRIQIEQSTSDPRDPYEFLSAAGAAEIARRVHGAGRR